MLDTKKLLVEGLNYWLASHLPAMLEHEIKYFETPNEQTSALDVHCNITIKLKETKPFKITKCLSHRYCNDSSIDCDKCDKFVLGI